MPLPSDLPPQPPPIHLDLMATTSLPIFAGGEATLEMPGRVRLSGSFGVFPAPYLTLANNVAMSFGGYDQETADLIEAALDGSKVWQAHLGVRPIPKRGFFVDAGYSRAFLGGGLAGSDVIEVATGVAFPGELGLVEADVASTLHMLDARMGWEWALPPAFVIKLSAGGSFTLGASTEIQVDAPTRLQAAIAPVAEQAVDNLNETYTTYVHTPTLQVSVGLRFPPKLIEIPGASSPAPTSPASPPSPSPFPSSR